MFALAVAAAAVVFIASLLAEFKAFALVVIAVGVLSLPFLIQVVTDTFTSASGTSFDIVNVVWFDANFQPNPNNERAYINDMAFRYYDAFNTGVGLGHANDASEQIHHHIGINSASLILIQGGIPLLLASTAILFVGFRAVVHHGTIFLKCSTALLAVVLMYASNPVADRYTLTAVCLFLFFIAPIPGEAVRDERGTEARRIAMLR